ncbi:ABC transporter permease [Polynucleobacter necessarius]|uniref:ABC transporter permease n=1 Tax=Polynucleobacter necessarius TaxID=576610 RepID=UPI000E08DDED|nr:ABC transporter permease [Polynucleobacter necessarius]
MGKYYPRPLWIGGNYFDLICQLIKRDIEAKYRGSLFGILWSLLNPFLYLGVYFLIFKYFLPSRSSNQESNATFILSLFLGLIIFNFFSDCINRSPSLITSNPNYVKKVVFPLELLVFVSIGSAFYNLIIGFIAWFVMYFYIYGQFNWVMVLAPIFVLPLGLFVLGFSWFLSALGVYIRDIIQLMPPLTQLLMFLSPIFYDLSQAPKWARQLILFNPLSFVIEQERLVLIGGISPDILGFTLYIFIGLIIASVGLWFFKVSRPGFADVL